MKNVAIVLNIIYVCFVSFVLVLIKLVSKAERENWNTDIFLFWNFVKLDQFSQTTKYH